MKPTEPPRTTTPRRAPRWRRRLIWALLVGLVVLAFEVGEAWYNRWRAERELRDAVADLDRSDPGWRFEDMQQQRRTITEAENGATHVRAAVAQLPASWPFWSADRQAPESRDLSDADLEALRTCTSGRDPSARLPRQALRALRAELDKVPQACREARRLAGYPDGCYAVAWQVDFLNTRADDLVRSRTVAELLGYDALARAEGGDIDGAWRSGHAAVNVGRAAGDEPDALSQTIRATEVGLALRSLEQTLARGEPDERRIAAVQYLLEREAEQVPTLFQSAFRGERALTHRALTAFDAGTLTLAQVFGQPLESSPWDVLDFHRRERILRAHEAYLRDMTAFIDAARLPPVERTARIDAVLEAVRANKKTRFFSWAFVRGYGKLPALAVRQQAYLSTAVAALAAERYRRAHASRWPVSLKALTPTYLTRVPTDPYVGHGLQYRRLDDGLVIYSVGPDRTDNGGEIDRAKPDAPGNDIGFRLWDVARRRSPAPEP